ncbi:hypothetical protein M3P05_03125 [Sansalvadorimonas sp. 2012CJ34-2]|uniref:Uncharacterized protein n=1 Tax=Parendozoicomonas callyspongiae TaxID=2942213 RepID=A0ABT0PCC1_9GAMM|nr:hypothetical protein [Sansalvadorimonas sp. 2012CJ34-2]MCL6268943.1 hypothetical protein [Sansalvadorimonas sp. 2012CJ34-2]
MLKHTHNSSFQSHSANMHHGQMGHDFEQKVGRSTRHVPESDEHNDLIQLHQRRMTAYDDDYDSGIEDMYDDDCPRRDDEELGYLDSGYFPSQPLDVDSDDDEDEDYPSARLTAGKPLSKKHQNYLLTQNGKGWNYRKASVSHNNVPENYVNHPHKIGLSKPTNLFDKIKDRLCDYVDNPILFVRLSCSIALHTVMGTMLASTFLGAGMTLGISAPIVGMVAIPVLGIGAIGGGVLGFYNDFILDKSLLPKDFNWLDGLTRTTYLPKYSFPVA